MKKGNGLFLLAGGSAKRFAAALMLLAAFSLGLATCATTKASPKPAILVVSFGTTFDDSRDITIGAVEKAIADANPDWQVRRAFTSKIIMGILAKRGVKINDVTQALQQLVKEGVKEVVVQPTLVMSGIEYDDIVAQVKPFESKFKSIRFGKPLLTSDQDYKDVVKALADEVTNTLAANPATKDYNAKNSVVVFMGHGTSKESANADYSRIDKVFKDEGYKNYYVATVEGTPVISDVIKAITPLKVKNVVILPLMVVAGDHANNDMAGDEDGSWKTVLEKAGYNVTPLIQGIGQYPEIQAIYVQHVADAINSTEGADNS